MANYNNLIFYDFETSGKKASSTQPVSLSCVVIDPVRLEIIKDGDFNAFIKPVFDPEECASLGIEVPQDEAFAVNKIDKEMLKDAPSLKEVWSRFCDHVKKFYTGNSTWGAPIRAGYNINNFDDKIMDRICGRKPYGYGPWDAEYEQQSLFHPIHSIDLMKIIWNVTESKKGFRSISFDTIRKYFGISTEGAHSSIVDCRQGAALLIKYMKWLRPSIAKTNLENSMKDLDILDFYDVRPL